MIVGMRMIANNSLMKLTKHIYQEFLFKIRLIRYRKLFTLSGSKTKFTHLLVDINYY